MHLLISTRLIDLYLICCVFEGENSCSPCKVSIWMGSNAYLGALVLMLFPNSFGLKQNQFNVGFPDECDVKKYIKGMPKIFNLNVNSDESVMAVTIILRRSLRGQNKAFPTDPPCDNPNLNKLVH
uniref:Uncharacterized protein n=1 Tax=Romanomermis culicivorax TaxID=13658 RepID=A0A915KIN0_ROMCU